MRSIETPKTAYELKALVIQFRRTRMDSVREAIGEKLKSMANEFEIIQVGDEIYSLKELNLKPVEATSEDESYHDNRETYGMLAEDCFKAIAIARRNREGA